MFTSEDLKQIEQRGSSLENVDKQIERFHKGFPWMKIVGAATPERGIKVLSEAQADAAVSYYEGAKIAGKCKFVPASGAASRMFKDIFAGLSEPNDAVRTLAANIRRFAFYDPALFEGRNPAGFLSRKRVTSNHSLGVTSERVVNL